MFLNKFSLLLERGIKKIVFFSPSIKNKSKNFKSTFLMLFLIILPLFLFSLSDFIFLMDDTFKCFFTHFSKRLAQKYFWLA